MYSLQLLQLIDSSCPTGSFSHSFGLETAIQESKVTNSDELYQWLCLYLKGNLGPMEGSAVYLTYQIANDLQNGMMELSFRKIVSLDQHLYLSKMARESREGSKKIGIRYLDLVIKLYPDVGLQEYQNKIRHGECFGNSSIVHGYICSYLGEPPDLAVSSYLFSSINSLIQNSIRSMALGQIDGQKVLLRILPLIEQETIDILHQSRLPDMLYSSSLFQEIASMRHETLYSRLFMS